MVNQSFSGWLGQYVTKQNKKLSQSCVLWLSKTQHPIVNLTKSPELTQYSCVLALRGEVVTFLLPLVFGLIHVISFFQRIISSVSHYFSILLCLIMLTWRKFRSRPQLCPPCINVFCNIISCIFFFLVGKAWGSLPFITSAYCFLFFNKL